MKFVVILALLAGSTLYPQTPDTPSHGSSLVASANVNSRYTIENIEVAQAISRHISKFLRREMDRLVGSKFDQGLVDDLALRIRSELRRSSVTHKVERGGKPDHVIVRFEGGSRWEEEEPSVTKASYHSKQGWTGGLETSFNAHGNRVKIGVQSDADALLERFAGLNAGVARDLGTRVRVSFDVETFHQQWDASTVDALDSNGQSLLYRARHSFSPAISVRLGKALTLTTGMDVQRMELQTSGYQTSSAWETSLRYRDRLGSGDLDAGYSLRAAGAVLGSDFGYTRQTVSARYSANLGDNLVTVKAMAGVLGGDAPLFERYVLGTASTLRGWNKFDIAPTGGNRMAHASIQCRRGSVAAFYDTGSVWEAGRGDSELRHSAGLSVALGAIKDGPYLTVALPIRNGQMIPLFIMSMNF